MPVGIITAFAGKEAPKGWLICDGREIPENFKALRTLLGSKTTPNLAGYFLRGLDTKQAIDPGVDGGPRQLLQVQADAVGPHKHSYTYWWHQDAGKSGADPFDLPGNSTENWTGGQDPQGVETRPKNVAVNYIIQAVE